MGSDAAAPRRGGRLLGAPPAHLQSPGVGASRAARSTASAQARAGLHGASALWLACLHGASALWLAGGVLGAIALGCGSGGDEPSVDGSVAGTSADPSAPSAVGGAGLEAFALPTCTAPEGLEPPRSIATAVDWINRLPKPLSLPCFLETLERPLPLYATVSVFSAQPAVGRRSPRMFVFLSPLIMSITPAGEGSPLLEFGEPRSVRSSLKGEIVFPVQEELGPAAPYDHLIAGNITTCGGCHGEEELASDITFARAFVSRALRPAPAERVGLDELSREALDCDARAEPERCAMLVAVFGQGGVIDAEFPAALDTFY